MAQTLIASAAPINILPRSLRSTIHDMTDDTKQPCGVGPDRLRNEMTAEDLALYGEPSAWRKRQRARAAKDDAVRLWLMWGKRRRCRKARFPTERQLQISALSK